MYKWIAAESELKDKIWAGLANSWQTSPNFSYNSLSAAIHDPASNLNFDYVKQTLYFLSILSIKNITLFLS